MSRESDALCTRVFILLLLLTHSYIGFIKLLVNVVSFHDRSCKFSKDNHFEFI